MQFQGNSVKVLNETILESDPLKQGGEYAFAPSGKIFPPVDELMIIDGQTYLVWNDLFSGFGKYAMAKDQKIEAIPPVNMQLSYNGFQPWVLKTDIVIDAPRPKKTHWLLLLVAGLFLIGKK
jgi:hypothetical protein